MKDKVQSVKKFLHDNAVTAITVMVFVVILGVLISDRYLSLYSIRNIANTNPLITSDSAELVAVNVNGVIKIIKDEEGSGVQSPDKAGGTPKNPTTDKSTSDGGGSTGGGNTGGSSGGGTSTPAPSPSSSPSSTPRPSSSPSPTPTPTPPATPLSATVSSLQRTNRRIYDKSGLIILVSCKNDHTIRGQVQITGGAGPVKLQWRFNNTTVRTDDLAFVSAGEVKTSEILITTSAIGTYEVTLNVLNSTSFVIAKKTLVINHSCTS